MKVCDEDGVKRDMRQAKSLALTCLSDTSRYFFLLVSNSQHSLVKQGIHANTLALRAQRLYSSKHRHLPLPEMDTLAFAGLSLLHS